MIFSVLVTLFILMPVIEIAILLKVHAAVGLGNTVALIIFTGVLGAALAKAQGLQIIGQIQRDMAEGRMPAPRIMDGVMVLVAGVLLITPGLVTDGLGFLLLVPWTRYYIRLWLRNTLEQKLRNGTAHIHVRVDRTPQHDDPTSNPVQRLEE